MMRKMTENDIQNALRGIEQNNRQWEIDYAPNTSNRRARERSRVFNLEKPKKWDAVGVVAPGGRFMDYNNFNNPADMAIQDATKHMTRYGIGKSIKEYGEMFAPTKGNLPASEIQLNRNWIPNVVKIAGMSPETIIDNNNMQTILHAIAKQEVGGTIRESNIARQKKELLKLMTK